MFYNMKKLLGWVLAFSMVAGLAACSKEEVVNDEWTSNYVYLERPHLGMDQVKFTQTHSSLGVAGDVDIQIPVTVKLVKAADCDIHVKLALEQKGGILPLEAVSLKNGGVLTIPAGQLEASDMVVFTKDWEKFYKAESAESLFSVKIESIEPENDQLRLSVKYNEFSALINKGTKMDVMEGTPEGEKLDRTGWKAYTNYSGDITADYVEQGQALDGDGWSYLYSGTVFCIKVDLQTEKNITGFELYSSFGGSFVTRDVEVQISSDGTNWKNATNEGGLILTDLRQYQHVRFAFPMKARYIRIRLGGSPALSEIQIYGK